MKYRKGFGVHSPNAYRIITTLFATRGYYYRELNGDLTPLQILIYRILSRKKVEAIIIDRSDVSDIGLAFLEQLKVDFTGLQVIFDLNLNPERLEHKRKLCMINITKLHRSVFSEIMTGEDLLLFYGAGKKSRRTLRKCSLIEVLEEHKGMLFDAYHYLLYVPSNNREFQCFRTHLMV